jgi:hypothetical protein
MIRGIFVCGMLVGWTIGSMTPAGPEQKQRQTCDQPEANWPEKPVHGLGERRGAKDKESKEGDNDNPRDNLGCRRWD